MAMSRCLQCCYNITAIFPPSYKFCPYCGSPLTDDKESIKK